MADEKPRDLAGGLHGDELIAATELAAGASIASRDAGGFAGCGLTVIDP
jgi:hypothetical protein